MTEGAGFFATLSFRDRDRGMFLRQTVYFMK